MKLLYPQFLKKLNIISIIDNLPTFKIGFGRFLVSGNNLVPSPPAKMKIKLSLYELANFSLSL